jgi:hypothetical protein
MSELQNKTVTMELNNLQLETIKCLFGHNDWEMKIIEQPAVVEGNGATTFVCFVISLVRGLCTIMPPHFFVLLICDARPTEAILAFLL